MEGLVYIWMSSNLKNKRKTKNETNKKDNILYFNLVFNYWDSCFCFWNNQYNGKSEIRNG